MANYLPEDANYDLGVSTQGPLCQQNALCSLTTQRST